MHSIRQLLFLLALAFLSLHLSADQYERFSENGKYGVKNTTSGVIVISAQYESVGWSNGTFTITNDLIGAQQNEKWALFKVDGTKITDHLYATLHPFVDGIFIAGIRPNGSILLDYGLINNRGKTTLPHDFFRLEPLNSNLIATKKIANIYRKGLLSKNGTPIIPITFKSVKGIDNGLIAVQNNDNLSALYNNSGTALTTFQYETIEVLNAELLQVKLYNRLGLIDRSGKSVVEPRYKVLQMEQGKARALPFKKWDYYQAGEFQSSLYFDKVDFAGMDGFAVNTGTNMGLVQLNKAYITYKLNTNFISATNDLTVIQDPSSGFKGAMNNAGKIVLPIYYDSLIVLKDIVLAQTRNEERQYWNILDRKGKKKTLYEYEHISLPNQGLIEASRNNKYGFIDAATGKESSPFLYDYISPFKMDLALVKYQGSFGVINKQGNWVLTPYSDSLTIAEDYIFSRQASEFKIFNLKGDLVTSSYKPITPLPQGYYKEEEEGLAIFDMTGERLLENYYDSIKPMHSDLYLLSRDNLQFFYVPSSRLDYELDSGIQFLGTYSAGFTPVKLDNQWGYLDGDAKLRIANRYEAVGEFSEGLFAVKVIGKWAFLDIDENFVLQPTYDEVSTFSKGLAVVKGEEGYGLIDKSGREILSLKYSKVERLNNYILLMKDGLFGIADVNGKLTRDPQFEQITPLPNGYFLVERSGLRGVIDINGKDIVPVAYKQITQMGDRFIGSESANWVVIDLN